MTDTLIERLKVYAAGLRHENDLSVGPNMSAGIIDQAVARIEKLEAALLEVKDAVYDAVIAELIEHFSDTYSDGPVMREYQARLIAGGVRERLTKAALEESQ